MGLGKDLWPLFTLKCGVDLKVMGKFNKHIDQK
jgi:hypothetical protein